jgi:ubiquinone/menaquinone biosynthesis C-methylase UbiE
MSEARHAEFFDSLAADYDARFSERLPAIWLRAAVRRCIEPWIEPESRVLELGCGTGIDAVWLAERGCRVLATDVSSRMLELARVRAARAGSRSIEFGRLDIGRPDATALAGRESVDLAFANFGVLNCVEDLKPLFAWLRCVLRPQGIVAATVMGRFCAWESVYFLMQGRPRKAARRWSGTAGFEAGGLRRDISYHTPGAVLRAAPGFARRGRYGIGALIPSSEAFRFCERFPGPFQILARVDAALAPHLYWLSDHYLLVLEKRAEEAA